MNPKQAMPFFVKIAPPLVFGVAIFCVLKSLFSNDEAENKIKTEPGKIPPENQNNPSRPSVNESGKFVQNSGIPANSGGKTSVSPLVFQAFSILNPVKATVPVISGNFPPEKIETQIPRPQFKRKLITRENMETIFQCGAESLTRMEAVTALKSLGFGKSAAYEALEQDGRFSTWLEFTPDGIITWKG